MMLPLTTFVIALLSFCITAEIAREVSFKSASMKAQPQTNYALALAQQPLLWLGIVFWAVEMVAWILVLQHAALSLAYPIMTLTYAAIPLAGTLLLKERLTRGQSFGAALVATGVLCVALSEL
jgi:multidrug transporter EmrE-like cation transporter